MPLKEKTMRNAVIQLIEQPGCTHVYGSNVERDYADPLYSEVLEGSLIAVNPGLPQAAIAMNIFRMKKVCFRKKQV